MTNEFRNELFTAGRRHWSPVLQHPLWGPVYLGSGSGVLTFVGIDNSDSGGIRCMCELRMRRRLYYATAARKAQWTACGFYILLLAVMRGTYALILVRTILRGLTAVFELRVD